MDRSTCRTFSLSEAACSIDATIPTTNTPQSIPDMIRHHRQVRQRVGQELALKRLYHHNNHNKPVAYHHGIAPRDRYLTGESSQYSNCAFLDGHDHVLAASVHGHVDILKLPSRHNNNQEITKVAGQLKLSSAGSSYDVSARYKLQSLQGGAAFAVGSPSGNLSIFATEHARLGQLPTEWKTQQRLSQEPLPVVDPSIIININNTRNQQWRLPFITQQWQTRVPPPPPTTTTTTTTHNHPIHNNNHDFHASANHNWWIKPHSDALWDIREHASGLLAVQAPPSWHGHARQVQVLDSRTLSNADQKQAGIVGTCDVSRRRRRQDGITALCLVSEYALVTAQARLALGSNNNNNNNNNTPNNVIVDNALCLWDLRYGKKSVWETSVQDTLMNAVSGNDQQYFVSCLTASSSHNGGGGQVMVTCSSHQKRSTVQHVWFDLGRRTVMSPHDDNNNSNSNSNNTVESSFVQQRNRNTTVFAVNPAHDFMACYDSSTKGRPDVVRLFDLSAVCDDETTRREHSRKRASHGQQDNDANKRQTVSHKMNDRINHTDDDNDDTVSSSDETTSDDDDSTRSESDGESSRGPFHYQGMTCTASIRPKLRDRYGLSTKLSCLAVNDSGTAIVGGSDDGDIFAWTGV